MRVYAVLKSGPRWGGVLLGLTKTLACAKKIALSERAIYEDRKWHVSPGDTFYANGVDCIQIEKVEIQ